MNQTTYQRDWALYNLAQTSEKLLAMRLISEAVDYLRIPYVYGGNGRPPIGYDDMIKACCIKVFNNFSSRRTISELRLANALGYIETIPHFNSISGYLRDEKMTPWLHKLVKTLALPLNGIEQTFAADSTGFSNLRKQYWIDYRLQKRKAHGWKKFHVITGILTKVIASVEITEGRANDAPHFKRLVSEAASQFRVLEVCADAGYISRENCESVADVGGTPYIMPKKGLRFYGIRRFRRGKAWVNMLKLYRDNQDTFLQHYHKRSNVESAFSSIKRKFLPYVRSHNDVAQTNEMLCKAVCHNASVLCNGMFELKVTPNFSR